MSNILITGVAGLLGSHLAKFLVDKGHNVCGLDNLSGGYIENVPTKVNFYQVDLLDNERVDAIIRENNINFVYHFAAYAAVGLSPFIRRFNYQNNVIASANLINAAIKNNVKKFIFASSMDVYGEQSPPFTEDMRPDPQDPYGIAKYAIEPFARLIEDENTDSEIINIGADQDVSINQLANIVQNVVHKKTGVRPALVYLEPRDEVDKMWCNHDKAKALLGFIDKTDLSELVEETWDWAVQIKPKEVKYMKYEIDKGMYSYWKRDEKCTLE